MTRLVLTMLAAVPLLAQTATDKATESVQKRIQGMRLLNMPAIEGKIVPALREPARRFVTIAPATPCAIAMPTIGRGSSGSTMPVFLPPGSVIEQAEVVAPRVCGQ